MNRLQFFWYAANINADDVDIIEYDRNTVEYEAALISSEGAERVRNVKEARENVEAGGHHSAKDENFEDTVQELFGRTASPEGVSPPIQRDNPRRLSARDLDVIRVIKKGPQK
jgi:hypothetical protein